MEEQTLKTIEKRKIKFINVKTGEVKEVEPKVVREGNTTYFLIDGVLYPTDIPEVMYTGFDC